MLSAQKVWEVRPDASKLQDFDFIDDGRLTFEADVETALKFFISECKKQNRAEAPIENKRPPY